MKTRHAQLGLTGRIFFAILIILSSTISNTWAQVQHNLTNNDTVIVYPCVTGSGTIYDNGGANGDYSNSFEGWAIISVPQGVTISLSGSYNTESGYDYIWVYDERGQSGTTLVNGVSGTGNINVQSTTGWISIRFHTDGGYVRSGFALNYSISGAGTTCNNPVSDIEISSITTTTASISWTADNPSSTFVVSLNGVTQSVSGNTLSLSGLNPNTYYAVTVSDQSDNMSPCCARSASFRTLCGLMSPPLVENFDDHGIGPNILPSCWVRQKNFDDPDGRYPQISGAQYVSAPGSLLMFCGSNNVGGHWALAIGPEIDGDISALYVRLRMRATNASARIEVGVCDDTTLVSNNFTPVDTLTITSANTWEEKVTDLSTYSGNGRRIAFRMIRSLQPGNGVVVYMDGLSVEPCGVWHISRQQRGISDFYVQWDNIGQPSVNIEIGPEGFLPGTGTMHTDVTSPYHFTGLNAGTTYQLRFYANCGGSNREQGGISASTLARDAIALDVCEGFENSGDNIPSGWRRPTTYDNTPRAYTNAARSGSRGLYLRPYSSGNIHPIAVMPRIDTIDIDQLTLSFWLRSNDYNTGYVEIGVMEYPEYASSFVPVDTVYTTTSWSRQKVSLGSYTGAGRYIAFRAYNPTTNYDYLYIDNLQVGPCLVSGQTVTNIAAHRVELRWDTVGADFGADSVTIEYGGAGFAEGAGTIVRVPIEGNAVQTIDGKQLFVVNGLEADSSYEFIIYGECAGTAVHCHFGRLSAHTLEADIALPYCQQFDGLATGGLPAGWSRATTYDSRPRIWNSQNRSGDRSLQLRARGNLSYDHSVAVLPMFDVDSVRGLTVSFYSYGTNGYSPRIQVGVMDNPNDESTFTAVTTHSLANGSWKSHVADLSSYTGTGRYIAFRYYHESCNNCSYDAYIDDIIVSDAATNDKRVYSVSSHGASFKWKGVGREFAGAVIEWGLQGFEPGTIRRDTVLANEPTDNNGFYRYTVDTLQPGTTYDLFITAISSDLGDLCTYSRQSFTTADEPLQSSYCYGFEDLAPEQYPWNYSWYRPLMYGAEPRATTDAHSGTYAMYLCSYYNNNNPEYRSLAAMPPLEEESLDGLTLRFYAKGSGSNSRFAIGMMSDPNEPSTFEGIDTFTVNHGDWRQYSIDLSQYTGSSRHIAFLHYSLPTWESGWVYFDDITISSCRIYDISSYSHTTSSFNIRWTPDGSIDSIQIEYGPQGFAPGTGSTVVTSGPNTTSIAITGLQSGTIYDYYVRPYCTGSNNICAEQKLTTATLSSPVAAGYCEDFEAYSNNQRPASWTVLQSHDGWPFTWTHDNSAYYTSYQRAFEFRTNTSGGNLIVMPAAEEDLADLLLSFNVRCSDVNNPSRPMLEVGVMTLPYDATTFTPVDTIRPTYNYLGVTVDFDSYNGSGRHIAFRYTDDSYRITYIDDLRLSPCIPTQIHTSMVTDSSVTISWTRLGYTDTTFILYDTVGAPSFSHHTFCLGTSTAISGLQPDRTYQFRLYGSCQDTALYCQGTSLMVTTLSAPLVIPVCETFEGYATESRPIGWTIPLDVPSTYTVAGGHLGQQAMRLTVRGANEPLVSYAAMPFLQTDNINSVHFEAWTTTDALLPLLTVGIMTDPYDTSTFTPIQTFIPLPYIWTHIRCSFENYNGAGRYIAFRASGGSDGLASVLIDDISLRSCAVTTAHAITPTENSISLQWGTTAQNQAVMVEYKATGSSAGDFVPGTGTSVVVTDSPHVFSNLQEATWYTFHVYPICDSISDGCNYETTALQTLHPWVDLPYCENFESISSPLPNNWLNLSTSSIPYRDYTYYGHDSTQSNYARLVASSTDSTLFVLPRIYIGSRCPVLDNLYANFWTYGSSNIATGLFEIGVMTDANEPATFTPHDTLEILPDVWQHHTVAISDYNTASQYVAFRLRSTDGSSVSCNFDDLCMEKCVAADVAVSDITQNSVTITWNNYSVDTLICEYAPAGTPLGSGTVVAITESPYTLSGLADGSEYEFTFASVCGCDQYGTAYTPGGGSWGGSGGWGGSGWGWWCCIPCNYDSTQLCSLWRWGPWTGHSWSWWYSQSGSGSWVTPPVIDVTTQAAMLETPYCENFEIADSLLFPPSWRRKAESHYPDIVTNNTHTGDKSMRFYATTGSNCHAALPPLDMGLTPSMVLTFYAYSANINATTGNARFIVGVMNDPDNTNTFTPVDTVQLNSVDSWNQYVVNFANYAGEGQYIAFKFAPVGESYSVYIDDLFLGPCAISGTTAIPDGSNVTVSWTSHNTPDHVQIQYGPQGADPIEADSLFRTVDVYSSPATVTIDPDSSYDFYVSTVCNDTATGGCLLEPLTVNPSLLLPYCEDFEGYLNGMVPDRWKVIQRHVGLPNYPLTETQHEGRQILAFFPGTGSNNIVCLLPPLPYGDSLAGKWVNVIMSSSYYNNVYLDFGYLPDTNTAAGFVQLGTVKNTSNESLQQFSTQLTLPAGYANGNRLAIRARSTSGDNWIRLDRIIVSNYPTARNVSYIPHGVSQMQLTWSNTNDNPYYTIEYAPVDASAGDIRQVSSDSCSALLSDLRPNTDYIAHFISPLGEKNCLEYRFRTAAYQQLPYCDDFSSYPHSTNPPTDWVRYHSRSGWIEPCLDNSYEQMVFRSYSGDICQIAMPDIDIDSIRHAGIKFRMYSNNYNNNALIIGVMDTRNGYTTFTPVDTVRNTINNSWQYFHTNLARYQGSGRFITFRLICTYGSERLYLDDLEISPCHLPVLTMAGSTTVKAEVPHSDIIDYYIEYAPRSFAQGEQDTVWNADSTQYTLAPASTTIHVTQNPFYIEDLEPSTTYTLYTRCDSLTPTCAAPTTITTADRLQLPYCDDFESYTTGSSVMPTGWAAYRTNGCPEPTVSNGKHIFFGNYCQNGVRGYAIMPDIDIDSVKYLDITFDMNSNRSNQQQIIVGVMSDPNNIGTFVPIDTVRNTVDNSWQSVHVSLSKYNGIGRFVTFCSYSTTSSCMYLYIDNLRIQSCPRVSVSLSAGATVRFDVDTTLSAPDYYIEYGPQGFTQLTEDTVWNADSTQYTLQPQGTTIHVTSTPFFVTGLDENTTYDFYTRCDSAVSTCFPANRIKTSHILPMPYCENFDSYSSGYYQQPAGWYAYYSNSNNNQYPYLYNGYYYSCCNSLYFYNYSSYLQYIALPDVDIDSIKNVDMFFNMRMWSSAYSYSSMIVGVMDNPTDFSTFTPVDTVTCSDGNNYQEKHVSFNNYVGNGRFIAFRYHSSNGWRECFVDDVRLQSCPRPSASLSAGTTVRFDVDTTVSAPDYWIEYGPQGITQLAEDTVWNADSTQYTLQPHNTIVHVTSSPFFITGLDENTTYDFYTRCDSAVSTCFPVQSITTSQITPVPYCLDFSTIANNQMPQGWRRYSNDGSYPNYPYKYDHYLYFYKYSTTSICQAVMPDFNIDSIKNLNLSFNMYVDYAGDGIIVGVMTNPDDPSTFTPVDTLRVAYTSEWIQVKPRLYRYNGDGRFIALRELTTGTYHRVCANHFFVENCDIPSNTTATLHGSRTVRIDADAQSSTGFLVEYGPQNFSQGEGTLVQVGHLPFDLELDYNTTYDFYFRCDTSTVTCRPKQTVTTQSLPSPLPLCEDFESSGNNLPSGWTMIPERQNYGEVRVVNNNAHSTSHSMQFDCYYNYRNNAVLPDLIVDSLKDISISLWLKGPSGSNIIVGAMSDPTDFNSFVAVRTIACANDTYQRHLINFSSLPSDARFIALRSITPNSCCWRYLYVDDLYIDTIGASDFRITSIESQDVTFAWSQVGNPAMTIEYGPVGFARGTGTTVTVTQSPYTISGLDPLTNYKFYFDAIAQPDATGFCNTNYSDSATVFTPAGGTGCIDPTNLTADYTACFYGTYGNPYSNTGIIDYGSGDIRSRHTVHYDPNETDPRTGGLLHIIPEGADASVRLGNWNSNSSSAEGEAITYSLFVDTTAFDLLVLKYAAVLQDPLHAPSDQPRFSLEVLDENNNLLDAQCAAADFIANRNLGWNEAAGNVLWKDWTTVGVDMSPYANQTVRIRLTSRDCNEGSHFGYAYFTLECMSKNMRSELCGDVDSNTFYAPAGFAYRWYSSADTTDTISTAQSIKVATDTVTYYCKCSFVDNANCHFTISAYAGTRYPMADFNYSVEVRDCQFHVTFNNTSTISADGINPLGTGEPCESAIWDFGDGEASTNYNVSHTYDTPGTYNVRLVSGIADDACTDTASITLTLALPPTNYSLTGDSNICLGQSATISLSGARDFNWDNVTFDSTVINPQLSRLNYTTPDSTTTYAVFIVDSNGCTDTLTHTVNVFPVSYNDIHETTVENDLPYIYINNIYICDTLDTIALTNFVGCDSIVHFSLHVYRNVAASADSTICQSQLPLVWNGATFDSADFSSHFSVLTSSKTDTLTAHTGADSVLTMNISVIPSTYATIFDTIVENQLPYTFNGVTFDSAVFNSQISITNALGCDSIISYNLFVHTNVRDTADSTICYSQLPLAWNNVTFDSTDFNYQSSLLTSSKTDTLLASTGADSVLTMRMTVNPVYNLRDTAQTCEKALPYAWRDTIFNGGTTTGDYAFHRLSMSGCDSTTVLHLVVDSNTHSYVSQSIIENNLPFVWNGVTFDSTDFNFQLSVFSSTKSDTLVNSKGCDSIVTMTLTVFENVGNTVDSTICQSQLPLVWNGITFDSADFDSQSSVFNSSKSATLTAHTGADSIVLMNVTIIPTAYANVHEHVNESMLPYVYHHHTYNGPATGDTLHITSLAGCDSIVTFSLSVGYSLDSTICQSQLPLSWNGVTFDSTDFNPLSSLFTSTKTDTLTAHTGADSIVAMTLSVIPTTYATIFDTIVENQLPYTFNGVTFDSAVSNSQISILNTLGCDSIISYNLLVHMNVRDTADSTICQSQLPLVWNNVTFDSTDFNFQSSIFNSSKTDTLTAHTGADSILTMLLNVIPTTYAEVFDTILENQLPYTFNGVTFDSAVSNSHISILNTLGCDSIISYSLFVHNNVSVSIDSSVCPHQLPVAWNDSIFTGPGSKTTILTAASGADSILTMTLALYPVYHWMDTAVVCRNTLPFTWRDTAFADTATYGNYTLARQSMHGCDSLMSLNLTIGEVFDYYDTVAGCSSQQPLSWRDTTINMLYETSDSTATDHVNDISLHRLTTLGCDSMLHLHLTVSPVFNFNDTIVICQNSLPLEWKGVTFDSSDFYSQLATLNTNVFDFSLNGQTVNLCDSSHHLNLTVDTNTHSVISQSIVQNQLPYTFLSLTATYDSLDQGSNSTTITTILTTANQKSCDSIIDYSLTIYHNLTTSVDRTICQSELPLVWNGVTFDLTDFDFQSATLTSTKSATLAAHTGADSVVTMNLHVNRTYTADEVASICQDALPYSWHGVTFDASDFDFQASVFNSNKTTTFLTQFGCDSTFNLSLHVGEVYSVVEHIESCEPIMWNDGNTYTSDTYGPQITLPTIDGCDSVVTLDFSISAPTYTNIADSFCLGTVYTFHDQPLTVGGIYYDTLQTTEHCDSIVALTLTGLNTPQLTISTNPDCESLSYNISVNSSVDYLRWTCENQNWNSAWGPQNGTELLVRPSVPTTLTLTADYLPQETCPTSQSINLNPIVQPLAQMQVTPEFLTYEQTDLSASNRSSGELRHTWFVDGVDFGDVDQITYTPDIFADSVTLMLTVQSEHCFDTATRIIHILRNSVYAPNAFTPDESTNREFFLQLDGIVDFELVIYNRQGLQVFHTTDPSKHWDGTYKGKPCPQANYVWILNYTINTMPGIPQTQKGSVLLLR